MTAAPPWLPPLELLADYGGDWDAYVEALYAFFKSDFVDAPPVFRGHRLTLKKGPLSQGKEPTFWHIIQEGRVEQERIPALRRCERIRWPRPIIEHEAEAGIKVWENQRKGGRRICLWFEQERYLVVLAPRQGYILLWTAYLVDREHSRRKLQREYEEYASSRRQKG